VLSRVVRVSEVIRQCQEYSSGSLQQLVTKVLLKILGVGKDGVTRPGEAAS